MNYEREFLAALKSIFVGAKIEGESGFINLMKIKSSYYENGVFPRLMQDIAAACAPFEPGFRAELFDKLYAFFSRYFSESGSIYFRHTPLHQNVYEHVYTDDRDVILFWKTHMLYYVKTDRLFRSLEAEVDGVKFYFDASALEHKRANEKRELVFEFSRVDVARGLTLAVSYSERGRKTKNDDILRAARAAGLTLLPETLERALRVFEKQSEVDYFINKNAGDFLREQFDLWLYQYVFKDETQFTEIRLRQLQAIKDIAYKIIAFIAQFEDELVKVWNKPKFVRGSHYIVTLDHLFEKGGEDFVRKLLAQPGLAAQLAEWKELGMLEDGFMPEWLFLKDVVGEPRYPRYRYLPVDTRRFPDMELEIIGLFADLDAALDGWLVHSENYQALNTLLPKFQEQVKCVHIDPPYNTQTSGFLYLNQYLHASWLTMMQNRASLSMRFLSDEGSFISHIDENEYERFQLMLDDFLVPNAGTVIWDKRNPMNAGRGIAIQHEYIIWRSKQETPIYLQNDSVLSILKTAGEIIKKYHGIVTPEVEKEFSLWVSSNPTLSGGEKAYHYIDEQGRVYQSVSLRAPEPRTDPKFFIPLIHPETNKPCPVPPNGFSRTPETLAMMVSRGEIIFGKDESTQPRQKVLLTNQTSRQISSVIQEARKGKADLDQLGLDFPYCHPTAVYKKIVGAASDIFDITLDFFAGSGTTAHAVMNLNRADGGRRKYILVEMGEHFQTVILPRIKKVAFSDKWKDGVANGGQGMSHFVKYYALEQYADALRRASYADAPLFAQANDPYTSYVFLRDTKMLEAVDLDAENNRVSVHLERLYPDIDLAETLSCLTGKWIRRITADTVYFQDGSSASLSDPDWRLIKPLVWW